MSTAIRLMCVRRYAVAIRRQKLDRKANLAVDRGRVVDMPPDWAFVVDCPHHGAIHFDFTRYRENCRDELAGHMRDAIWSLRHEVVGKTLEGYGVTGLRRFWRFLDDLHAAGESITRLDQIDRRLLDRYLAWMELQIVTTGKNKGQRWSVGVRKHTFDFIKALLTNRQRREPHAASPNLTFPHNQFPNSNQLIPKREPYSTAEQKRILEALTKDLRTIHEGDGKPLTDLQVLGVHLLIIGLTTGRNLQSLLDLRRDSLREHPLPDRELLVTFKRRGWSTHATSIRKGSAAPEDQQTLQSIPSTVGDHIRFVCETSALLASEAAEGDREFVFLWRVT